MTLYLIEENVLREMRPGGDANVLAWLNTVADADLRLSAMTLLEKRRGWERLKKTEPKRAVAALAKLDELETAYAGRIIAIDEKVSAEWARLLGVKDKNQRDMAIAATARVHSLVVVTRNVKHFTGRQVQVLNPFKESALVETV